MFRIALPPSPPLLRLVVLDPQAAAAARCAARLHAAGRLCRVDRAETLESFMARLREGACDLALCTDALPEGRRALDAALQEPQPVPFLFFVPPGSRKIPSVRRRLELLRAGASDYLIPAEWNRLPLAVEQALREIRCTAARRHAEHGQAIAAQKLQTLLDHHRDGFLLIQAVTGTILRAGRAVGPLLGYAEEELIGRHFSVLFPPEAAPAMLAQLRVCGPVFEGQPFRRADGAVLPLDVTAALVGWGQTEAILTTLRDAAPRRNLEREVFWNRAVADRCRELALWTEADGKICEANHGLCQRLGFPREELIGRPLAEIDPGFGSGLWPLHWEEVKARGRFRLSTRLRQRDGGFLSIDAQIHHLAHDGREYQCLLAREQESAVRAHEAEEAAA